MLTREFFPCLVNNPGIVYLDNASTTQIHQNVLDAMNDYYTGYRASPGRGSYPWATKTYDAIQEAKQSVANLLHGNPDSVIFTTGATQSLNWIAKWHETTELVMVSEVDHNSNLGPWLMQRGAGENGSLEILETGLNHSWVETPDQILDRIPPRSLICISTVSNVLGVYSMYMEEFVEAAKKAGHIVCLDISQQISTSKYTGPKVDYYVFSGHKMYGPSGIGVLYTDIDHDPLYYGGGQIIDLTLDPMSVLIDRSEKHSVGTPNVAAIIGLGEAAKLVQWGYDNHSPVYNASIDIPGFFGDIFYPYSAGYNKTIYTFSADETIDVAELGEKLADRNIFVRTGRLCAHNTADSLSPYGLLRISIAHYTTADDLSKFVEAMHDIME